MRTEKTKTFLFLLFVALVLSPTTSWFCGPCAGDEQVTPNEGLVMHLSFDVIEEGPSTIVLDQSGYENHGVLLGGKIVKGRVGNALKCLAVNRADGVRVRDHNSLDLDSVTIAVWIKTYQLDGQWNRILDKGWKESYNLCIGGDYKDKSWWRNRAQFECAHKCATSKTPVVDDQWHFITATYDGKTSKIYIDGKLDVEKEHKKGAVMKHNKVDVMIGQLAVPEPIPYDYSFFNGLIDEVRLYNRVLSAGEIAKLYKSQAEKP